MIFYVPYLNTNNPFSLIKKKFFFVDSTKVESLVIVVASSKEVIVELVNDEAAVIY